MLTRGRARIVPVVSSCLFSTARRLQTQTATVVSFGSSSPLLQGSGGVDSVTAGELVWGRYIDCWRKKIRFNGAFPHATERLTHEQMVGGYRVVITFYKKKPNEDARAIWALLGGLGVQGLPEAKGGGDVEGAGGSGVAGKVGGATSSKKAGGGGTASGKGKAVKKSGDKKGKK